MLGCITLTWAHLHVACRGQLGGAALGEAPSAVGASPSGGHREKTRNLLMDAFFWSWGWQMSSAVGCGLRGSKKGGGREAGFSTEWCLARPDALPRQPQLCMGCTLCPRTPKLCSLARQGRALSPRPLLHAWLMCRRSWHRLLRARRWGAFVLTSRPFEGLGFVFFCPSSSIREHPRLGPSLAYSPARGSEIGACHSQMRRPCSFPETLSPPTP